MSTAIGTIVALVVGFLVGLLTFKQKQQWCPVCGARLRCPDCVESASFPPLPEAPRQPTTEADDVPGGIPPTKRRPADENGCGSRTGRSPRGE